MKTIDHTFFITVKRYINLCCKLDFSKNDEIFMGPHIKNNLPQWKLKIGLVSKKA